MKKVLITGVCGFVGHALAVRLRRAYSSDQLTVVGIDNLVRPGAASNLEKLKACDVKFVHGDVRLRSDLETMERCDWIIDAAANASVLAGTVGQASSRQLIETNLFGTFELLELCKQWNAGLTLLSTSRVYSLADLCAIPIVVERDAYAVDERCCQLEGVSRAGVTEKFSTRSPVSLYGSSKLASELLAIEYANAFAFPLFVNRCGVIAGAGQFGRPDQGIFSFWLHSWRAKRSLQMIGFDGLGRQVRDCLHPDDLFAMIDLQMRSAEHTKDQRIINVSGGAGSATSLSQLSDWCRDRWGETPVQSVARNRIFDVPWLVLDSSLAEKVWGWRPERSIESILAEIAEFAESNPNWLDVSGR